jgi:glycosyltransferase involved in cell wall biosynthesis
MNIKTAYIHARPFGHPIHKAFAESLNPENYFIDFILRWHDKNSFPLKRYLSWILCALFFPEKKKYNVFYTDGLVYFPVLMKILGLIDKNQKVIGLMDDETLYFLHKNYYSTKAEKGIKKFLIFYDGFICVGEQQSYLAKIVLGAKCPPIKTIFNGVADNRIRKFEKIEPDYSSNNIIFIANISSPTRALYKGFDLALKSFSKLKKTHPELKLIIVGEIDPKISKEYLSSFCPNYKESIELVGKTAEIDKYLMQSSLYLHPARGEAYGISVLEAMFSGLPTIVSNWTGSKEVVAKVDKNLIFELDVISICEKVNWYYTLSIEERIIIGRRGREIVSSYSYSNSINEFKSKFQELYEEIQ